MTPRRERRGARLAFFAGALILLGGGSGSAALYLDFLALAAARFTFLGPFYLLALLVLPLLAAFGGLAVMSGAFLHRDGRPTTGLLFIEVGSGLGFLGLLLGFVSALQTGLTGWAALGTAFLGVSGLGLLLSLVARGMLLSARLRRIRS